MSLLGANVESLCALIKRKGERREEEREELCLHHVIVHDFKASIMSYKAAVRKIGILS